MVFHCTFKTREKKCGLVSLLQLDVLLYIHSNEYVHANINAENIYVKPGNQSQVRGM